MTDKHSSYTKIARWDTDRSGSIDNVKITDYLTDHEGNIVIEEARTDSNNDGRTDTIERTTREFDDGLVTSELVKFDNLSNDEFDKNLLSEYRYDADGGLVWFRSSTDYRTMGVNADGVWDSQYTQETTLDDQGRVVESFSYTDYDADGAADTVARSIYRYADDGTQVFMGHYLDGNQEPYYSEEVIVHDLLS